jgi:hypothetical protein
MSGRGLALRGVALLMVSLGVSCSNSDSGSDTTKAPSSATTRLDSAFVARAESACAPYAAYNDGHYFPIRGFSRFDPDVRLLPGVAAHISRNPAYRTLVTDLEALDRPDSGEQAWSVVVDDFRAGQAAARKEIASARHADGPGFTSNADLLEANTTKLHADLRKLGLSAGSPCYGAQGDPLARKPMHGAS